MLLKTKGIALNIHNYIVGRVTRNIDKLDENHFLLLDGHLPQIKDKSYLGVLTTHDTYTDIHECGVYNIPNLDHLGDGDVVVVFESGVINTIYRLNSFHNTLLATERCNSNCLMCSQPPKDRNDIPILFDINKKAISLIPKDCVELGISGGEPTLMGEQFYELIETLKTQLPNTEVHVLTNGRSFAWDKMAYRLEQIDHRGLMLGIPLYSDYYQIHDFIVQAKNAFYQTMLGIHNLERYRQRVEIRIVLHQQSIPRLTKLSKYIFKNLPFVEHVAFMGLEYIGYTPHNINKLWIDPYYYQDSLAESVEYLSDNGLNVSIYNTPLCLIPERLWPFAKKSISDWKVDYLPECRQCDKLEQCGGFFTWNLKKHSDFIKPFKSMVNL